jgi:RNA polymerase sigma-70 factor, ECF subfamily
MISDRELLVQLKEGSLEALGTLYDRHKQMVYRTALAITGDVDAAADLLQDVFLRLYRFADRVDPQRPIEPWLYRMTANLSYTWVKRSHRWLRPLEEVTEWLVNFKRGPHPSQDHDDEWSQVSNAISCLPLSQRMVVVLYYLNGMSLQEISEITAVPIGTVKSRLHYGREALKQSLGIAPEKGLADLRCDFT